MDEYASPLEVSKAQQALDFVHQITATGASETELHNTFFGNGGKFGEMFPARAEREAFAKTPEYQEIFRIQTELREQERVAS